ncbi:metallophosphoesterase family protein [Archaeoglobus veneficus]|uniref:Metallophosphoesterase n=1 Tax=Archaeoglobus veneficus (strain DSM 11195 / SNP6) TaxID=693661 RepID=F2KP93_ARCVS|nr:metallophosphoesterase family protein [Archaeoglobus veneficus]AEA47497.1 hypothetical protein Arcve_1495 [Archaeoglobus veneficus SNP6]
MQVAVISNLHGNLLALASALSKIERLREKGEEINKIYVLGVFGLMPYPKEVYQFISSAENIFPVRGKYDHLIAKWRELEEDEKERLREDHPDFVIRMIEWNWEMLGKDGRSWLRNDVPAFIIEKFGEKNEILFVYGEPFNPTGEDVKPKMPTSYYESLLAPLRKYEMLVVAGPIPFIAETRYGKVVCPGSAGFQPIKDSKPSFAIIDTDNMYVAFDDFEYSKKDVEDRIKEYDLPSELIDLLHHGYM